jgi:TolB-like protein/Tfp pilus assembly protein PilF
LADIFISYARADKVRVERLVAALQARGWNVWWDAAVSPGEEFDDVIAAALERAKAVLVVWTPASVASRWVRGEARVGADRGILVPVRFDGAMLPIDARAIHTIDLDDWDYDSHSPALQQVCQSIAALLGAAAPSAGTPSVPEPMQTARPSLAVMPFVNLSGDPQQDYFADGMMEEIVTALSRVRSIFVIASGSTLCFKGKAVSAQAVGRQLGVRYLLEGSVRRSGDRVRIAPKLVDTADGSQIWAERYDGTLEDVFTLQDQVALNVVGAIVPTLQNAEIRRASSRPTANMGGYDLFLRALALVSAYEKPEAFEALDLLDRAIALDSRYALAMALAAYTHAQVVVSGWSDDPGRHRRLALDLARRAVQLADDDSEVLSWVTGAYLPLDENFDDSIVLIDRSIALNPGSSLAWLMSGWLRAAAGDADRAVEHFEMSMRLDPCSSDRGYQLSGIALARFGQGRYAEAAALLKESLQLQPTVSINQALLAACYGHLGEIDAARAAIASYQALSSRELDTRVTLFRKPEHRKAYLDGISLARPGD